MSSVIRSFIVFSEDDSREGEGVEQAEQEGRVGGFRRVQRGHGQGALVLVLVRAPFFVLLLSSLAGFLVNFPPPVFGAGGDRLDG